VGLIGESALQGNLAHRYGTPEHETHRAVESTAHKEFVRSLPERLAKPPGKMGLT
jgi:hypothetical protein